MINGLLKRLVFHRSAPHWNVLFITVDDLNTSLGCYGAAIVQSPQIDRLAARCVRFARAYCQSPLCNPSRASFLSGRRPATTGVYNNQQHPRFTIGDVPLLPEYFRQHGYFTARVGKVAHDEPGKSFEEMITWDYARNSPVPAEDAAQPGLLPLRARPADGRDEDEPDGRTAQEVVRLLEQPRRQPFFIACGFQKPHWPYVAPQKYFDLYPLDQIQLPPVSREARKDVPPVAFPHYAEDAQMTPQQQRQAIRGFYACISFVDAQVGVLLEALDRCRLWDRTVVVFFSDHGFHYGEHGGLWRKMTLFAESTRVPLLIAAPGRVRGAVSPRLAELVDLYPTLADLCGLPPPPGMEGTSLRPLLDDPRRPWKPAAFTDLQRGCGVRGRAVHTEHFRYTEWGERHGAELYDLDNDPREGRNLINDTAYAATLADMRRLLDEGWQGAARGLRAA